MDCPAPDDYAYCATLTCDQWAWEFLRRNPDYQSDYRRFIEIWHALEADYGAPPNRDFSRWKRDPRAYGPLPGDAELAAPGGELCTVDDDRVLLECWMGAKWGFHKFPLDPARTAPAPDELSWRPPPQPDAPIDAPYRLDVTFDLSLPLPPQLEAAKFRLVSRAAELRRQGLAAPKTVANQRVRWTTMLRLLDGTAVVDADTTFLLDEARSLVAGDYREILRLAGDVVKYGSPRTPQSLLGAASSLVRSVECLALSVKAVEVHGLALLSAHALEIILKAFLLAKGVSEEILERKIGHDLCKAWRKASSLGLEIATEPPRWCDLLDRVHGSPYLLRYPPTNTGMTLPNLNDLSANIRDLYELVQRSV